MPNDAAAASPTPSAAGPSAAGSPAAGSPAAVTVPASWGWPMWRQLQADPSSPAFLPGSLAATNRTHRNWVVLGTVARPERSVVDPRGMVTPFEGGWSLDWWIGAEDRWYLPSRETTVRQRLVDAAPVVETAMRVAGGDIVHRCWAMSAEGNEPWLVVEIENRTSAAVAVALAVRPWGPAGPAPVGSVAVDGPWLVVDGRPAVVLPQEPWRAYGATGSSAVAGGGLGGADVGPVVGQVLAGGDGTLEGTVVCPDDAAEAATVVPLPHTLVMRVAIPMAEPDPRSRRRQAAGLPVPPATVPTATQVAAGWRAQAGGDISVDLPDPSLSAVVDAARRHLLLSVAGEDLATWPLVDVDYPAYAEVLGALAAWGHPAEAADVLGTWEERQGLDGRMLGNDRRRDAAGAALVALGNHWRLTGDTGLVESQVGVVAKAAHWIDRRATSRRHRHRPETVGLLPDGDAPPWLADGGVTYHDAWWSLRGLRDAAAMLGAIGQPDAASDAGRYAATLAAAVEGALVADADRLGSPVVPVGPGRPIDAGVVGIIDAVLLGILDPQDPRVDATVDVWRSVYQPGSSSAGVFDAMTGTGLSPMLAARVARVEMARGEATAVDRLRWLVGAAGGVGAWPEVVHPVTGGGVAGLGHDPVATASFLLAVRDLLVIDTGMRSDGVVELQLLPVVIPSWLGGGWEVHNLPTSAGTLGFAVRWHGDRPALLWELDPGDGPRGVVVRAPGLDPDWSSTDHSGEALLGRPAAQPAAPTGDAPDNTPGDAPGAMPDGGFS